MKQRRIGLLDPCKVRDADLFEVVGQQQHFEYLRQSGIPVRDHSEPNAVTRECFEGGPYVGEDHPRGRIAERIDAVNV